LLYPQISATLFMIFRRYATVW